MKVIEHAWKWAGTLRKRVGKPKYAIFHHAAAITATPEQVHSWHRSRGWLGIAYHYYVRKDGSVHRGRPEWAVGGHTKGYNREIGICCEGDFTRERMPAAQLAALKVLRAEIHGRYPSIVDKRHKDLSPTACPGTYFPWTEVVSNTPAPAPAPVPPKVEQPLVKYGSTGKVVRLLQQRLNELRMRDRYGRVLKVDGVFGRNTLYAVRRYQKKAGLAVDGIVGPKTWRALGY